MLWGVYRPKGVDQQVHEESDKPQLDALAGSPDVARWGNSGCSESGYRRPCWMWRFAKQDLQRHFANRSGGQGGWPECRNCAASDSDSDSAPGSRTKPCCDHKPSRSTSGFSRSHGDFSSHCGSHSNGLSRSYCCTHADRGANTHTRSSSNSDCLRPRTPGHSFGNRNSNSGEVI